MFFAIEDENTLKGIVADKPIEISEWFSIGPRKPSDLPHMPQSYIKANSTSKCTT
jgi:hypothetical protein